MSRTFSDVWKEAADLSESDRAALAGLLIESLEGEQMRALKPHGLLRSRGASRTSTPAPSRRFRGSRFGNALSTG